MAPGAKRAKTAAAAGGAAAAPSASPLSLYRAALKLARQQQACGGAAPPATAAEQREQDAAIERRLSRAIDLLTAPGGAVAAAGATAEHSLDLDPADDPALLLASARLQLGQLHLRQDRLGDAEQQLRRSLESFPAFAAAHGALGQVLKAAAGSEEQLRDAERHLAEAVAIADRLSADALLVESNKACGAELEAADAARAALAMLLCQEGRCAEADPHLAALDFRFRLSREVLHYALPDGGQQQQEEEDAAAVAAAPASLCLQVIDDALPQPLLEHLRGVFAPGAPFWSEHNYGRVGYFSYFFRMDEPASSSSMHQLAHHLQQLTARFFPAVAEARYAEFWAHCRRHSSGHQLHYDSDDEGHGGVRNPIVTSVLYLAPNTSEPGGGGAGRARAPFVGGPTLVTDQVLGGPLAAKGWLSFPAANRFTVFDGRFLHGVIPGRGATPSEDARRSTLMVAFWRELQERTPPGGVGACMPMPDVAAATAPAAAAAAADAHAGDSGCSGTPLEPHRNWHAALAPRPGGWGGCEPRPLGGPPPTVGTVWTAVGGGGGDAGPAAAAAAAATYDACFQGF